MMDTFTGIVIALLVGVALGGFAGHAAGYARRGYVEHSRRIAAMTGGPRYARNNVGRSE